MTDSAQHAERLAELSSDNRVHCLAVLREHGDSTLAEVAQRTGLSRPTVRGHLEALVAAGIVREGERGTTARGGRPAVAFSIVPEGAFLAVFDASKHEHRFLLCDFAGVVRAARVASVDTGAPIGDRGALIERGLRDLVAEAGLEWADVRCVSGSVGAQVDSGGAVVRNLGDVALLDQDFADRFRVAVTLENDLKAAAFAEQRIGCAQGLSDVVYALAWHQVAAGIVIDGRIRRGRNELAGELNRVRSSAEVPAEFAEAWRSWPSILEVLEAAERGERSALASAEAFITRSAQQIAMLAMSVDPEMIVLGGPLVHRSDYFLRELESRLSDELPDLPQTALRPSSLRSWAPALGATLRGLEALESAVVGGATHSYQLRNSSELTLPEI